MTTKTYTFKLFISRAETEKLDVAYNLPKLLLLKESASAPKSTKDANGSSSEDDDVSLIQFSDASRDKFHNAPSLHIPDTPKIPSEKVGNKKTTKLNSHLSDRRETAGKEKRSFLSFLDESKKLHKCDVTMIDIGTRNALHGGESSALCDPSSARSATMGGTGLSCFWCRHPFDTVAIGCPIKYVCRQAVKRYKSNINKDVYTIKENITPKRSTLVHPSEIQIEGSGGSEGGVEGQSPKDYYETDGIFCSFECTKAFIDDNKGNSLYIESTFLLLKLYNEMYHPPDSNEGEVGHPRWEEPVQAIEPAPSWRLLKSYGGYLSISEFRESFSKAEYFYHGPIKGLPTPSFRPIGHLYEESLKF